MKGMITDEFVWCIVRLYIEAYSAEGQETFFGVCNLLYARFASASAFKH